MQNGHQTEKWEVNMQYPFSTQDDSQPHHRHRHFNTQDGSQSHHRHHHSLAVLAHYHKAASNEFRLLGLWR